MLLVNIFDHPVIWNSSQISKFWIVNFKKRILIFFWINNDSKVIFNFVISIFIGSSLTADHNSDSFLFNKFDYNIPSWSLLFLICQPRSNILLQFNMFLVFRTDIPWWYISRVFNIEKISKFNISYWFYLIYSSTSKWLQYFGSSSPVQYTFQISPWRFFVYLFIDILFHEV